MSARKVKILRIVLIVILCIIFALYIALPAGFGLFVSLRASGTPGDAPDGFESVSITTEDNVKLAAWYKAPENGAAVLLIHGSNGSRESVRQYASMLSNNGYGVLAIDLRGHGESAGAPNALGWQCTGDIKAAVEFLGGNGVESIGALGTSLGGEVLLRACSDIPEISAVVSDGATHGTLAEYLALPSRQSIIRSWTTRVMYFFAQLFTGQTPPDNTILDSITGAAGTRFLFIAAQRTEEEEEYNSAFSEAAGSRGELWLVPEAGHTQALSLYPEEYESRVIAFFDSVLLKP